MNIVTPDPVGFEFHDDTNNRDMMLVGRGWPYAGWICYRTPDGPWATLRKATRADKRAITVAAHKAGICGRP